MVDSLLHLADFAVLEAVTRCAAEHAWENGADNVTRMAFFHNDARLAPEALEPLPQPLELME